MNYDMDAEGKWCYLVGLYAVDGSKLQAKCQLYSLERGAG